MEKAKVYFSDLRTSPTSNLLDKMERLLKRAGIGQLPLKDSFTAIKIHFGEPGNLAYIRPNYAARMANLLRSLGAKPFLTDCNTLYSGRRSNAVDHLQSAMENGFNPISAQCQVIIADGLKGTDYREIPIDGEYCPAPKIGTAIADADIIISMNHFKGHEQAGFGGALKNLGMGCASVGGKLELHASSQPKVATENCIGCNICVKHCAHDAIHLNTERKAEQLLAPVDFNFRGKSILLVDDRIKTGATIKLARELLKEARSIKTFAVNGTADYALFDETCFKFPWIL